MFQGKVTNVEATYMPAAVSFQLDKGDVACPAGGWLRWENASLDNNKAVFAALLSAQATGKLINFYHTGVSCTGSYLHVAD